MAEIWGSWQAWYTLAVFFLTFFVLIKELLSPDLTMFSAAIALLLVGIVSPADFLLGFSEDIIFSIAMLCIIVRAMETSGIVRFIADNVLSNSKHDSVRLLSVMLPVGVFSAFLNNTPIVLLMTSAVRHWALARDLPPSKYLIPLSYAAILGGTCTLIGSSATLVVHSLLHKDTPGAGFTFFEMGQVGVPCAIVGVLYMLFLGHRYLPVRVDTQSLAAKEVPELVSEFVIGEGCPLIGLSVQDAGSRYFRHEYLIEIEREGYVLESPSPQDVIELDDRLIFVGDVQHIAELHAIKGLQSTADPHFHIDVSSPHFSEVVISVMSPLAGKTLKEVDFRTQHGASVLAVFRGGKRVLGLVGDIRLQAGDTLMLLSKQPWQVSKLKSPDFYYIRHNEELSLFSPWRFALGVNLLVGMVLAVIAGVPLVLATLAVATILLLAGVIDLRQAKNSIRWDLLILIASAFSLGSALQSTGVAEALSVLILKGIGSNSLTLLATLFVLTSLLTAFVTNTAAVVLLFPLAIQTAHLAGFESISAVKAVGACIVVAASCSFATPIGYQTNTIVYGPGGYQFNDYVKVGLPLTVLVFFVSMIVIPYCWPM